MDIRAAMEKFFFQEQCLFLVKPCIKLEEKVVKKDIRSYDILSVFKLLLLIF